MSGTQLAKICRNAWRACLGPTRQGGKDGIACAAKTSAGCKRLFASENRRFHARSNSPLDKFVPGTILSGWVEANTSPTIRFAGPSAAPDIIRSTIGYNLVGVETIRLKAVMQKKGSNNVRRRFKRNALPSALMGLVVFSFTLVGFGAAVYTATLPSLVTAAQHGVSDGLLVSLLEAIAGGDDPVAKQEDSEEDASAADESENDDTEESAEEATSVNSSRGMSVSLNGLSLRGIAQVVAQEKAEAEDSEESQEQEPQEGSDQVGNESESNDQDTDASEDKDEGQAEKPKPDREPDPVKEQAFYEFLVSKAQLIEGYLAEANACVDAFNADCTTASLEVRLGHQRTCASLGKRLLDEYIAVRDIPSANIPKYSNYTDEQEKLIGMFRCLNGYVETIYDAWTLNVAFENPGEHVDEFMSAIYADEQNGVNKHLAEFQQYANGFEL